jgi:hypothetical protein
MTLRTFAGEWREAWRFRALPREQRRIVFYAEDGGAWPHFEPILEPLLAAMPGPICYLTSDRSDPVLRRDDGRVLTFAIGGGAMRAGVFATLEADVVVMTTPELDNQKIKRSARGGCYVYVHHSMVSTHMIYRPGAFDAFDAILCVGPHHVRELRADEQQRGLRVKALFEHGYGRLDTLLTLAATPAAAAGEAVTVLLAPSWGPDTCLEKYGVAVVRDLLALGYRVIVRPHPMTTRRRPEIIEELATLAGGTPALRLDGNIASTDSLFAADMLVTDWSGIAMEYAFARERPVLFLDVPRKINNPGYERLGEPLEAAIRSDLGRLVAPERPADLAAAVTALLGDTGRFVESIRRARARWVFNVGQSGTVAADLIARIAGVVPAGGRAAVLEMGLP